MSKLQIVVMSNYQKYFLQIAPVNVKQADGKFVTRYERLDTDSESKRIREDLMKNLKLREKAKLVNITSIKKSMENISIKKVVIQVADNSNTSSFVMTTSVTRVKKLAMNWKIYRDCRWMTLSQTKLY